MRAYGVRARTADRIDGAIDRHYRASVDAQKVTAAVFVSGEFVAALANAAVVVVGVLLGLAGEISAGTLVAFLFLVTLFVAPVQTASEVLNEAQNAVAGFRRVLDVIDTEPDVRDPALADPARSASCRRARSACASTHVSFRYAPGARLALDDVDLTIEPRQRVAIVGETGSGKTTFAKLVTRLMDPVEGRVLLGSDRDGWVPLDEVAFASLRSRVVMVPQDGFLFDATVAENVRYGRPGMTDAQVAAAFEELGLGTWVEGLAEGVATPVGPARRVAVGGGAAAGRGRPRLRRRPRPAGARRGHQRGRPGDRAAADPRAGHAHRRPDDADHRPPAVHRRAGRRGARRRRRAGRPARAPTPSWSTPTAPTPGCTPPGGALGGRAGAGASDQRGPVLGSAGCPPQPRRPRPVARRPCPPSVAVALALISALVPGFFVVIALGFSGGQLSGVEWRLLLVPCGR